MFPSDNYQPEDDDPPAPAMTFNEYQEGAQRTWRTDKAQETRVTTAALGLAGEAGEVCDLLKKFYGHDKALDLKALRAELGDVLYYIAALCIEHDWTLEDIARENNLKLRLRHPNGFSPAYHNTGGK